MFFLINKIEQGAHHADGLQNPKTPNNPMVLGVYRTLMRTAICSVYSKKAYGEFWDDVARKKISRRYWTSEMKTFATHKVAEAPKPPFIFKLTIVGWIFILLIIAFFGYLTYESVKPPLPKPAEYVAMDQAPAEGDIYFGNYEIYKEKGNPMGAEIRFGWFKVLKVDGDLYHIAKSTEMNRGHKSKEKLNSTDFETESMPLVKLKEQTGYNIRFISDDDLTEIYITDKK
ncbi:hypothetical protein [Olivibacter domesticus]|uniref:Uncharacterized protein n=1 Tax=Olivibacter domesticus TaxID=407022 RepID=A0A1H7Q9N0_OLID1|nr:hypothetical protein [Olivibacter domesticus]SEL44374.1 hypothetical protein SAMN05661044_02505 [Olivibacter domesticus]